MTDAEGASRTGPGATSGEPTFSEDAKGPTSGSAAEYMRVPIPAAILRDGQGRELDVRTWARYKALLLVFVSPEDRDVTAHLVRAAQAWKADVPTVRVRFVVRSLEALGAEPPSHRVLADPDGHVHRAFSASTTPMAVLLGTDGLLAAGPVEGIDQVIALVDHLIERLGDGTGSPRSSARGPGLRVGQVRTLVATGAPSPRASVGLVVATFGAPGFVALQLESAKRFAPGLPVMIHDDCSGSQGLFPLAQRYGATLVTTPGRLGHVVGDLSSFVAGIEWGQSLGLDYVVKVSRRFVPVAAWLPEFLLLMADRPPTIGAPDRAFNWPLRTEFLGLRVDDWAALVPRLKEYAGGHIEGFMGRLAESLGPTEPLPFLGPSRAVDQGRFLWYNFAGARRYAALATDWGLPYGPNDFNTQPNLEGE